MCFQGIQQISGTISKRNAGKVINVDIEKFEAYHYEVCNSFDVYVILHGTII